MHKPITVAYLEDDVVQSTTVARWFATQGIQCQTYSTAETMTAAIVSTSFDAIMLDVQINGEAVGLTVLEHVRRTGNDDTPILMVSSKAYWQEALTSGADDFLEKPLSKDKLLVHIDRLLRPVAQEAAIETYPPYQLNASRQQITIEGDLVDLSEDEYALASMLFRHFGKVVSYKQLLDKLPTQHVNASVRKVEADLHKLKRKMDLRDIDGWRLESVYSHGYRLVNAKYDYNLPQLPR